eukprot:1161364-Pelagomonas_calceolata.AAC.10
MELGKDHGILRGASGWACDGGKLGKDHGILRGASGWACVMEPSLTSPDGLVRWQMRMKRKEKLRKQGKLSH